MKLQDHEKWIKEQLTDNRIAVDTSELWEQVREFAPIEDRRNRLFLWLFFGLFACGIIGGLVYFSVDKTGDIPTITTQETNTKLLVDKKNDNSPTETQFLKASENNPTSSQTESQQIFLSNTHNSTRSIDSQKSTLMQANPIIKSNEPNSLFSKTTKNDFSPSTNELAIIVNNTILTSVDAYNLEDSSTKKQNENFSDALLDPLDLSRLTYESGSLPNLKQQAKINTVSNTFSFHFLSGVNMNQLHFLSPNEELTNVYDEHVSSRLGYFLNIGMFYSIHPKWNLECGIDHNSTIQEINYSYEINEEISRFGIKEIIILTDGNQSPQSGEIKTFKKSTFSGKWYQINHATSMNTGIHYTFYQANRWKFRSGIGLRHTVYNNISKSFINNQLEIAPANEALYNKWIYKISPYLQLSVDYQFTKLTSIFFQGDYITQNTTINDNNLNFNIYRLGLGCRYRIR